MGASLRKTVLIVDDNYDAADLLAMFVHGKGHRALVAYDSKSGLEIALGIKPDVIFHDIAMPYMSGYTVARQLRRIPRMSETVLVALTAYDFTTHRHLSRQAGFDHHILKPIES